MSAEIRQLIRSILVEELAAQGVKRSTGNSPRVREEVVSIQTDHDLQQFVRRLLDMSKDPHTRTDLETSRVVFRLDKPLLSTSPHRTYPPPASVATGQVINIQQGLVTERQIRNLPAQVSVLKLGKAARLTPLARDASRQAGIKIERLKT